jgi:hypothetical protein
MQAQVEFKRIAVKPLLVALAIAAALLLAASAGYLLRGTTYHVAPAAPAASHSGTLRVADRNDEAAPALHDGILKPQR